MKHGVVAVVLLITAISAYPQDTVRITKELLEQKIITNNLQIKIAEKQARLAETELLASRALYLPSVTASYGFTETNNPMMAFGYKMNQGKISMNDFDPVQLNSPKSLSNFGARLEVQQPLLNIDGMYQKKAGQLKADVMHIRTQRAKEQIRFELNRSYMMLQMAYKILETLESAKSTVLANKKLVDDYFQNGLVKTPEVLNVEVRLSEIESRIQSAKSGVENASGYLYFLIDEDATGKILKPSELLRYAPEPQDNNLKLNPNRKDLLAYHKSLESYDWLIKSSDAKFLPRLNAFGSYDFADNQPLHFGAGSYMAGIQLSWNIFDGLKANSEKEKYKATLSSAKTQLNQYTKQSQLELDKAFRQLRDAQAKVNLANQARGQSTEAYRIIKNRYQQGLEKTTDLMIYETQMTQKELEYYQAVLEHNVALEYLHLLQD